MMSTIIRILFPWRERRRQQMQELAGAVIEQGAKLSTALSVLTDEAGKQKYVAAQRMVDYFDGAISKEQRK